MLRGLNEIFKRGFKKSAFKTAVGSQLQKGQLYERKAFRKSLGMQESK